MKKYIYVFLLFSLMLINCSVFSFDHSYPAYTLLLAENVEGGWVDYKNIIKQNENYKQAIENFNTLTKPEYDLFNREQKIAYMINAYNLFTIKAIVDNYPVKSIKDIRGVWNKLKFSVAGQRMTLDNIEHDILRKEFKEERIHVAVVCASISCPALWNKPFLPDSLDFQLTERAVAFVNDSTRNEINFKNNYFKISKILDWYGNDFKNNYSHDSYFPYLYGKKRAAANFIFQHLDKKQQKLLNDHKIKIGYLDYNWKLNEKPSIEK